MQNWLFVPGDQPDRIRKAFESEADRVIVDWEDAVAPQQKDSARLATAGVLGDPSLRARCVIRVNPPETSQYTEDLAAVADLQPGAVMTAKTEHPQTANQITGLGLRCVALIESALGVEQAFAIASVDGVEGLAFGSVDYLADIHAAHRHEALHFARGRLVNAARAAGLAHILDGPNIVLDDQETLEKDALLAQAMGFSGKLVIHPKQVSALRQVFRPSDADVKHAREIIHLFEQALRDGKGVIRHGDLMIDAAVARQAHNTLAVSDSYGTG